MKNYNNFSHVFDSQSASGMSLALFSAINEWQLIVFLKRENNMFAFSCYLAALTHEISG